MTFHIHKFEAGSLAANQRASQNSALGKAKPCSEIEGLLTNKMPLTQRQHQKHSANVETNDHKANLPEQINHCGERPSAHVIC